jgi:hypothetical protein
MPRLETPIPLPDTDANRRARSSGQRRFAFGVDAVPSVIESPNVTVAPTDAGAMTSTRAMKYQDDIVLATGKVALPVWLPGSET